MRTNLIHFVIAVEYRMLMCSRKRLCIQPVTTFSGKVALCNRAQTEMLPARPATERLAKNPSRGYRRTRPARVAINPRRTVRSEVRGDRALPERRRSKPQFAPVAAVWDALGIAMCTTAV